MMCGSKCFIVEIERDGVKQTRPVNARTPAGARKVIRGEPGAEVKILSVKEEKKDY